MTIVQQFPTDISNRYLHTHTPRAVNTMTYTHTKRTYLVLVRMIEEYRLVQLVGEQGVPPHGLYVCPCDGVGLQEEHLHKYTETSRLRGTCDHRVKKGGKVGGGGGGQ